MTGAVKVHWNSLKIHQSVSLTVEKELNNSTEESKGKIISVEGGPFFPIRCIWTLTPDLIIFHWI